MGPQVRPGACCCTVFPWGHILSGIHLLQQQVLHGLQVDIWSSVDFHGFHRDTCLIMVCTMGCRRIFAPALKAHPPPPCPLTLLYAELFLSHCHYSSLHNNYFFFLNTLSPEILPPLLIGSALAILELAGIGFTRHRGHFWKLLTRTHFCSHIATKILAWKTNIPLQWFFQTHWVFHILCSWLKMDIF